MADSVGDSGLIDLRAPKGKFRVVGLHTGASQIRQAVQIIGDFERCGDAQQSLFRADSADAREVCDDTGTTLLRREVEHPIIDPRVPGIMFSSALGVGSHVNTRRTIGDVVIPVGSNSIWKLFDEHFYGSDLLQIKFVTMTAEAVASKFVRGQYYHTLPSNQHEFFVVNGPDGTALFEMRYALPEGAVVSKIWLHAGDMCLVPPGIAHGFMPLVAGATLISLSNLPYNDDFNVAHDLF